MTTRLAPTGHRYRRAVASLPWTYAKSDPFNLDIPDLPGAACTGNPEAFFPSPGEDHTWPRKVCKACPVNVACLTWALEHHPQQGIWAGTTLKQRNELKRKRRAA